MHVTGHNNQLIEHILSLLKFLQVNHIEIEHLMEENELDAPLSSRDAKDIRTAYEIIKFMDDIPGGFLIYHATRRLSMRTRASCISSNVLR